MKKILYILSLTMILGLLSCTQENNSVPAPSVDGHTVLFSVTNDAPSTRATVSGNTTTHVALAREKSITNLYAVAYKDGFYYKSFAAEANGAAGAYKFDMLQSGTFKVYLIANPSTELIGKLDTEASTPGLLGNLLATQPAGEDQSATNFLMTSEPFSVTTQVGTPANAGTVRLTRAAARFDFYNTVKGLAMTKLTFKHRAVNTRLATGTSMSGISRTDTKVYGAAEGLKAAQFIGGAYGYENTEVGTTVFVLEGTYNGKAITPQEIVLEGIAVKRNHLYSIVIRTGNGTGDGTDGTGGDDDVTPGTDPGKLKFDVIVNDWDEDVTLEWKGNNLINTEAPSFTITGANVTTTPASVGGVSAVNPIEVAIGTNNPTDLQVMVTSASSASSNLMEATSLLPDASITAGPVGHSDDGKLTQTFTIHLPLNRSINAKQYEFVLSNVFHPTAKRSFSVVQEARPKIAIDYVTTTNVAPDKTSFVAEDNNKTNTSGYFLWTEAKMIAEAHPGYHLPSREEWAGVFPYLRTARFSTAYSTKDVSEYIAVTKVNGGNPKYYLADYISPGNGISYALRFKGGDNRILAAYRFELLGSFTTGSKDARLRITVRYLGSGFTGTIEDIAVESFWSSNNNDDVSREFPACGDKSTASSGGFTSGYYWSTTEFDGDNARIALFDSSATSMLHYTLKDDGLSVRLFTDN